MTGLVPLVATVAYETESPKSTQLRIVGSPTDDVRSVHTVPPTHYEDHPAVVRVATAVADHDDRSVADLPPLANVVDPDALNDLFRGDSGVTVTFSYGGYEVTLRDDGTIELEQLND